MSPPRKPRSPSQRQFGPGGPKMGSDADWHKVVQSPGVQRMLRDPHLASALYQNFRQTGGQMPQPPSAPMAEGGPVPMPEVRPMRPVRGFQAGGESMADIDAEDKEAHDEMQAAKLANDAQAQSKAQTKIDAVSRKRAAAMQNIASPSGPISMGNTQVSGSTMQGLQRLGQQGPPTLTNVALPALAGAVMGGGGTGKGAGALIGGATAGLLTYLVRKNAQRKQQQAASSPGGGGYTGSPSGGGYTGVLGGPGGAPGVTSDPNTVSAPTGTRRAMQAQPDGTNKYTSVPYYGDDQPSAAGPSSPPSGSGLYMGTSRQGNVKSSDGKSWQTEDGKPLDPNETVVNQTQVKKFDQPPSAQPDPAAGVAKDPDPELTPDLEDMSGPGDMEMREGGLAPEGRIAHHLPIPILHTTIVIAGKPKKNEKEARPGKKAMGGEIAQMDRRPRRPLAVPPAAGPQAAGARLPHGRVQVPRGSGAAIKGKRFGGVY